MNHGREGEREREFGEAWGTKLRKEKRDERGAEEEAEVKTGVCMSAYVSADVRVRDMPLAVFLWKRGTAA